MFPVIFVIRKEKERRGCPVILYFFYIVDFGRNHRVRGKWQNNGRRAGCARVYRILFKLHRVYIILNFILKINIGLLKNEGIYV